MARVAVGHGIVFLHHLGSSCWDRNNLFIYYIIIVQSLVDAHTLTICPSVYWSAELEPQHKIIWFFAI